VVYGQIRGLRLKRQKARSTIFCPPFGVYRVPGVGIAMSRAGTKHTTSSGVAPDTKNDTTPPSSAFERHYSPTEIAAQWNLSEDAVRRLFEKEPGVLVLSNSKPGKRRYRTLRIPDTVAQRVHRKLSLS